MMNQSLGRPENGLSHEPLRVKAMPSCPMTPQEIKNQCNFISECLDAGVDEIREDDEWMFGS
jgi:hypothetical protein